MFTSEDIDRERKDRFGGDSDKKIGLEKLLDMTQKDNEDIDDFARRYRRRQS